MSMYWYDYRIFDQFPHADAYPGLSAWLSIYKVFPLALIDRSGPVRGPIKTTLDPHTQLPEIARYQKKSFEECCLQRARELMMLAEKTEKPICVMFSGGIDSTTVVVSFLRSFELARLRDRLKIVLSTDAWLENPRFLRKYLIGNFEFIGTRHSGSRFDGSALIVNGDPTEYGIFAAQKVPETSGSKNTIDLFIAYLESAGLGEREARLWAEIFSEDVARAPMPLPTFTDMLWWCRFVWTWQSTCYQCLRPVRTDKLGMHSAEIFHERVQPFFDTPEFQVWAMTVNTDRSPRKNALRKFILEFTGDEEWTSKKAKVNSMVSANQFILRTAAINGTFSPLYTLDDVLKNYDPGNAFV